MKKMKFHEFLEIHASLLPAVSFAPGMIAYYDLIRSWNTIAILFPEKCEDVMVYEEGGVPTSVKNDLNLEELQNLLANKALNNLPDNQRTRYNPVKIMEEKRRKQEAEKLRKEKAKLTEEQAKIDSRIKQEKGLIADEEGIITPSHVVQDDKKSKTGSTKKTEKLNADGLGEINL